MKILLNQNKEEVEKIQKAIEENEGYCPCQLEKNKDTICMCKNFRMQSEGWCHCGLYYKEN